MQVATSEGETLIGERGSIIQEGTVVPGVYTEPTTYVDIGARRVDLSQIRNGTASAYVHDPSLAQPTVTAEQAGQLTYSAQRVSPAQDDWEGLEDTDRQRFRDHGAEVLGRAGMTIAEPPPGGEDPLSVERPISGSQIFDPNTQEWPGTGDRVTVAGPIMEPVAGIVEMRSSTMTIGLENQQLTEDTALSIQTVDGRQFEVTGAQIRGGEVQLHLPDTTTDAEGETQGPEIQQDPVPDTETESDLDVAGGRRNVTFSLGADQPVPETSGTGDGTSSASAGGERHPEPEGREQTDIFEQMQEDGRLEVHQVSLGGDQPTAEQERESAPETNQPAPGERVEAETSGDDTGGREKTGSRVSYADIDPVELPSGTATRIRANITALETANHLQEEHRYATPHELRLLAGYTGWGGLGDVFDPAEERFHDSHEQLKALISDQAYHTLRSSILNAHYTPPELAEAIWDPIREAAAGRESLRVLEPGSGTGHFFRASGLAGADTAHQFVGVEMDETTARISSLLHPEAEIHHAGYEATQFADDSFDLAIGNVPFGSFSLPDPVHNTAGMSIHNHFIYKSLAQTAPGGYVAVISSRFTMDAKAETARRAIARHGNLVGAVRLPEGAQSSVSGTTVGTDVLILRKREPEGEPDPDTQRWVTTTTRTVTDGEGVPHQVQYNTYFDEHPENVLGTIEHDSNPFGPGYRVTGDKGEELAEQVRTRITAITTQTDLEFSSARTSTPDFTPGIQTPPEPEARFGEIRHNPTGDQFEEYTSTLEWKQLEKKHHPKKSAKAETLALIGIRNTARSLVTAQRDGTNREDREQLRDDLRQAWVSYSETYGPINRRTADYANPTKIQRQQRLEQQAREWVAEAHPDSDAEGLDDETLTQIIDGTHQHLDPGEQLRQQWQQAASEKVFRRWKQDHLAAFTNDPSLGLIQAVENLDRITGKASPAAMLQRDIVTATSTATRADTPQEAVGISMAERGHVDVTRVAELLDLDQDEVGIQLEGLVFTDPVTSRAESATTYLSGNVREKLHRARAAAESQPEYAVNVAALEGVQPETIALEEITLNPGVPWLDQQLYEQFAHETFGVPVEITHNPHAETGKWHVTTPQVKPGEDILYQWGTSHRNVKPWDVMEKTLNSQVFTLTKADPTDPSGKKRLPDPQASDAANDKAAQLKERFRSWITEDAERAQHVQDTYNRLFNSMVPADYSQVAQQLEFPGLAQDREPYTYQRQAVARALNEPAVLLDHVVGAGKTGSMIMTAMEKRRLGHAAKPALVVPNHLVGQINAEWKQWYPDAEVMAIPSGLTPPERRELFARAAAGEWDAVILAESVFDEVSIDPVRHQAMMEADIDAMRDNVAQMRANGASKQAIKKAESDVKAVEKRYHGLQNKTDTGLVFEETGIDYLMVDEAHHFKNLRRSSDVPELDGGKGSQRAENLNYILQAMREDRIDRAKAEGTYTADYVPSVVLFSTGTPVANKVSEMWVMQSYLRPDLLAERGLSDVTAWGDTFTEQDWRVIATPDGRYQRALKVTGFANVPELLAFNRSFQDSVTRADLEVPLPQVSGGERQLQVLDPTEEVEQFVSELQSRVDKIKAGGVDRREDNVLKIVHEGRMAALDPRLMNLEEPADGGRAAAVATQISRIHEHTAENTYLNEAGEPSTITGGLQIVFADLSTPKPGEPETFTIYDALKTELTDRGMDPQRVAFIHDAATEAERAELFDKARSGEINVLIGSTQKMGTGMNVQARAVALHHIDPPWRPADIEQREGRIIRQGNQNTTVSIHAYGTAGTTDTFMWSKLSQKAAFIEQMKNATNVGRTMEDPLGGIDATAANAQAVLSGDERIGELLELESEITTLERLEHTHLAAQARARGQVREHHRAADAYQERLPALRELATHVIPTAGDAFVFTTPEGQRITNREEAGGILAGHIRRAGFIAEQDSLQPSRPVSAGELGGVQISVYRHLSNVYISTGVPGHEKAIRAEAVQAGNTTAAGLARTTEHLVASTTEKITKWEHERVRHLSSAENLNTSAAAGWDRGEELEGKRSEYAKLRAELNLDETDEQEQQVSGKVMGPVLTELGVMDPDRVSLYEIRDFDTVRLTGGPDGDDSSATGYYTVKRDQVPDTRRWAEEGATTEGLVAWKEGDDPSAATPVNTVMFINDKVKLVAREADSLTEMEKQLVDTFDDPEVRKVRGYAVSKEMRISVSDEHGNPVTGTVTSPDESRQSLYEPRMIHIDGQEEPEPLGGEDSRLDTSIILHINHTPAESTGHTRNGDGPMPLRMLTYGCVLSEDIDGVGKAGNILINRTGNGRYLEPYALDTETGTASRVTNPSKTLAPEQYTNPVMLTEAERAKLGAESEKVLTTTGREGLRPGDQVVWRDVDKRATTGQPVTLTRAYHRPYQEKSLIEYTHPNEGTTHDVDLTDKREIRVLNRAKAALNTEELVKLAVRPTRAPGGASSLPQGVVSATAEQLADPREHFGTDTVEVVVNLRDFTENSADTNTWQIITGTLCDGEVVDGGMFKATLVTDSGQPRQITADITEFEAVVPAHPIEVSDLNLAGQTPSNRRHNITTERGIVIDPDNLEEPLSRQDPDATNDAETATGKPEPALAQYVATQQTLNTQPSGPTLN